MGSGGKITSPQCDKPYGFVTANNTVPEIETLHGVRVSSIASSLEKTLHVWHK
jgi:hypothetical protein